MTSAMGIKKTLKQLKVYADVHQQNQETAHNMLYRIEQELTPPTIASAMKAIGQSFSGAFGSSGKVPPYPKTIYTMVKALYDNQQSPESGTADAVREVRNRLHDHTQTTDRKLNGINNTLTRLADKLQSYEPTKDDVRERDSLTNGVAKLRADVATLLMRVDDASNALGTQNVWIREDLKDLKAITVDSFNGTAMAANDHAHATGLQIDALQNQLAELRAEHHAAATAGEPVKVYASKGTTEMLQELKDAFGAHRSFMVGQLVKIIEATEGIPAEVKSIRERLGTMEVSNRAQAKATMEVLAEMKRTHSKEYQELYSAWYGSLADTATVPEVKHIRERLDSLETKLIDAHVIDGK